MLESPEAMNFLEVLLCGFWLDSAWFAANTAEVPASTRSTRSIGILSILNSEEGESMKLLITGDWHYRSQTPVATRLDDFQSTH